MSVTGRPRSLRAPDPFEEWDRDADGQAEQRVVNVSPYTARFEIGGTPGSRPRRIKLEPGQSALIQGGYTRSFIGASRQPVRATIESLTEREVYPKGPRLPMCVHEERANEVAAEWRAAIDNAAKPADAVEVAIPAADGGEPVKTLVRPPSIAPSMAAVESLRANLPMSDDDEDQAGGPLDEPPPEDNDPPVIAAAPEPEAPKGRRSR